MEILRRTKGIDLSAKKSGLLGQAEISLIDVKSGKVTDKIKQKNTFTTALDSLYNGAPFGLGCKLITDGSYTSPVQMPLYSTALGGIMLFPNALSNNLNDYYPNFATDYPTGYASMAEYTQDDARQGAFDSVNSGEVTNGYKYVYNWGSAFGNGRIATVSLSNIKCYKYFNDMSIAEITPESLLSESIENSSTPIGANSRGIYYNAGYGSYESFPSNPDVWVWKKPSEKIPMIENWTAITSANTEKVFRYPNWGYFFIDDDYLYFVQVTASSSSSSTFKLYKVDLDDYEDITETTHTVSASLATHGHVNGDIFAIRNGYMYLYKSDGTAVIKISLSSDADIDEIELPATSNRELGLCLVGDLIIGKNFTIDTDDVVRTTVSNGVALGRFGVWTIYSAKRYSRTIGASILAPYCATKAVLENPVTKDNTKQMIVNYTVTQV